MPKVIIAIDGNMVCTLVESQSFPVTLDINFNGYIELLCERLSKLFQAENVGIKILMLPLKDAGEVNVPGWGVKKLLNGEEHPILLEKISTQMSESLRDRY